MAQTGDGSVVIVFDSDVSDAEKKIAKLKTEIQNLKTELSKKEFKQDTINERLHILEAQIKKQTKLAAQLSAEDQSSNKYSHIAADLAEMNKQYEDLVTQSEKLAASIKKDTLDLQALCYAGGELQAQVEADAQAAQHAVQQTNEMQKALESAKETVASLQKQGKWFGDDDYDKAYRNLALMEDKARQYAAELAKTPAQAEREAAALEKAAQKAQEAAAKEEQAAAEANRLREIAESAVVSDENVVNLNQELNELKLRLSDLKAAGIGEGYQEFDQVYVRIADITQRLKEYRNSLIPTEQAQTRLESTLLSLKAAAIGAAKGIAELTKSGLQKLVSATRKASSAFLALFKSSNQTNKSFGSGIMTMLKYSLGIRSLYVLFNKLRGALTEGFEKLDLYSDTVNDSISMVTSALAQLKNSLATAFAPILTVVAPILTQFINLLSATANAIARLTAMLTGQKSYVKATSVQEDYAASLEGTAGAAEDAARSLAGFDEITKLSGDTSSGGGAGSGAMFETVEIEPLSFESWGQAFSTMLDSILNNGIPKLKTGLTAFANWLNTLSANLYEMFKFPGVYDKVVLLGAELANALNGFANQIDWETFGGAIGAGLNSALGFLTSLVYTFDWQNFGAYLAEALNNAISEVNWSDLGALLWAKFKIALETLTGLLRNVDMVQLAQAAGSIVTGFFNAMTETVQSIDWIAVGEQIKTFLVNIDWEGVATSVCTAIGAGFAAALNVLFGMIKDYFAPYIEWANENGLTIADAIIVGLLEGIVRAIVGICEFIRDNIYKPFIDAFCEVFGIHSPSTVMAEMGVYLMKGLFNGATSMITSVVSVFLTLWGKIQGVFAHVSDWFKEKFSAAWQAVKDVFSSGGQIFDGIKEGIISGLKAVVNALISGINKVVSIPFNGINNALETIKNVDILGLKPFSWINTISVPQIPYLAQGAVIPPNREFMAVLGDQKHGTNIEAPLETIQEAVAAVMEDYSMANLAGHEATVAVLQEILEAVLGIEIGDEVIGRAAARYQREENISRGGA